ncbi:MAG TPA: hypothetical protein DEQ42_13455 [Shigella sp.]|nr:hypothetical protein [Shigella sp.]
MIGRFVLISFLYKTTACINSKKEGGHYAALIRYPPSILCNTTQQLEIEALKSDMEELKKMVEGLITK